MSEEQNTNNAPIKQDQLATLKARADLMGIPYHHASGVAKLKELIKERTEGEGVPATPVSRSTRERGKANLRRKNLNRLVRVRISNMNPNKKAWKGEYLSVGNKSSGTIKRYVQYSVPWHVPKMLLGLLEDRKFQVFSEHKDSKNRTIKTASLVPEFAIEYLSPLSVKEYNELGRRQAVRAGKDRDDT